jgi:hypothetical protein
VVCGRSEPPINAFFTTKGISCICCFEMSSFRFLVTLFSCLSHFSRCIEFLVCLICHSRTKFTFFVAHPASDDEQLNVAMTMMTQGVSQLQIVITYVFDIIASLLPDCDRLPLVCTQKTAFCSIVLVRSSAPSLIKLFIFSQHSTHVDGM